jgi:hypothetical protein
MGRVVRGDHMALYLMPSGGSGGPEWPSCLSCRAPIVDGQPSVRVYFNHDPHGHKGFSGLYHSECSRPFASIARVINSNWFGRF